MILAAFIADVWTPCNKINLYCSIYFIVFHMCGRRHNQYNKKKTTYT